MYSEGSPRAIGVNLEVPYEGILKTTSYILYTSDGVCSMYKL